MSPHRLESALSLGAQSATASAATASGVAAILPIVADKAPWAIGALLALVLPMVGHWLARRNEGQRLWFSRAEKVEDQLDDVKRRFNLTIKANSLMQAELSRTDRGRKFLEQLPRLVAENNPWDYPLAHASRRSLEDLRPDVSEGPGEDEETT